MSNDNGGLLENEFIQIWDEKEKKKRREFMDEIVFEKEKLEKISFFTLDLERDDINTNSLEKTEFSVDLKNKNSLLSRNFKLNKLIK